MIKDIEVEVDGVKYKMPKEITVTHYGEIMRRFTFCETETEKVYDIVDVLLGIPYQLMREMDPEKLADLSIYLQEKIQQQDIAYQKAFKFNGVEYGGIVLNKMTFGEYVDIANYMKDEANIFLNIHKISSILYRPINKGKVAAYNIEEHEIQSELFKQLPVKYFFGAFKNLFTFLHQIKKDFSLLFGDEDDKRIVDWDEEDNKDEEDKSNLPWYKMIMLLAGDDFTKLEYVTSRPMVECFNHLTYIKIKNEEHRRQLQQQQLKNMML